MTAITYHAKPIGGHVQIGVFLSNRRVGTIYQVKGGWQYRVDGSHKNAAGDIYATLGECKKSLEAA